MGQAKTSLFLALLRKVILLIPLAIILPRITGSVMGIYVAEPVADILASGTTLALFLHKRKTLLPNMNFLGVRQPEIYGKATYDDLADMITAEAERLGVSVQFFQSNHEGELVDAIQKAYFDKMDGILINPAAYTHTSVRRVVLNWHIHRRLIQGQTLTVHFC